MRHSFELTIKIYLFSTIFQYHISTFIVESFKILKHQKTNKMQLKLKNNYRD